MTSKRKLRAEIERLHGEAGSEWLRGFKSAYATHPAPWAAHLARVADAAREQGRQEGYASLAAEVSALHRRNDDSPWCDHGVGGWPCPTALLVARTASDPQPQPETTPDGDSPSAGEVNRFSGGYRNSQGEWVECGRRACQPDAWRVKNPGDSCRFHIGGGLSVAVGEPDPRKGVDE